MTLVYPVHEHTRIEMPPADHHVFAPVVLGDGPAYQRTFHYDAELRLLAG